jgi:hypothetical protein
VALVESWRESKDPGHRAKVLLHSLFANGLSVGGKLARADAMGKHLEERDGVLESVKGRVKVHKLAQKVHHLRQLVPPVLFNTQMDASSKLVLANAVDSPRCCSDVRCSICRDVACRKARSKKERSCESGGMRHQRGGCPCRPRR